MSKLIFPGNIPSTIRNNILKLPVIPAGAFSIIKDGVQDGRQNVYTPKILWHKRFLNGCLSYWTYSEWQTKKSIKIWPLKMDTN